MPEPSVVLIACGLYVGALLTLGFLGRRARTSHSLSDHFLAGRSIGFGVLLMTLFATQYSGNSLSGFPGQTFRAGLPYIMSVTFMVGIVSGYLLFAPRLLHLARGRGWLTPTDFLAERFRHRWINRLSAIIFALTLANFLLAQLMAMGHALTGLTDGRVSYAAGVLGGASVILVYELLGGLRAVAWTDVLQGGLLALGLAVVVALLVTTVGTPADILATVAARDPAKVAAPDWRGCATWLSTFLLLGLGGPLYPQAIQRLYAARRVRELRQALAVMAVLPLFAISTVVFIGMAGLALFPELDRSAGDQITFRVLAHLAAVEPLAQIPVLMVVMAVVAAIMSTADSALLSLSSIAIKDGLARRQGLDDQGAEALAGWIPVTSLVILGALLPIALHPRWTLWRLLEFKFELLIQISPAFVFGTARDADDPEAVDGTDILRGLVVGIAVALGLYAAGHRSIGGVHAGVVAVVANYLIVLTSRAVRRRGVAARA